MIPSTRRRSRAGTSTPNPSRLGRERRPPARVHHRDRDRVGSLPVRWQCSRRGVAPARPRCEAAAPGPPARTARHHRPSGPATRRPPGSSARTWTPSRTASPSAAASARGSVSSPPSNEPSRGPSAPRTSGASPSRRTAGSGGSAPSRGVAGTPRGGSTAPESPPKMPVCTASSSVSVTCRPKWRRPNWPRLSSTPAGPRRLQGSSSNRSLAHQGTMSEARSSGGFAGRKRTLPRTKIARRSAAADAGRIRSAMPSCSATLPTAPSRSRNPLGPASRTKPSSTARSGSARLPGRPSRTPSPAYRAPAAPRRA